MKEVQEELFGFEWYHARPTDPPTSRSAATDTKFRAPETKLRILRALADRGPQTCDQLRDSLGFDCHQRVSDLANLDGMIADTGKRRLSDRGSTMIIWEINGLGLAKLSELDC